MQYVNAVIAAALLGLAFMTLEDLRQSGAFVLGAILAAVAFKHWLNPAMVRLLAVLTAGMLFWYFSQFFVLVAEAGGAWRWRQHGVPAAGALLAGFAMIPVLSEYTCRMKASGQCERARRKLASSRFAARRTQSSQPVS